MGRLPLHLVVSLLAADVVAFDVLVRCAAENGRAGRWAAVLAAATLAFGATAALCERTWGVGLVLASAAAFFVAGALNVGSPHCYAVAAVGVLPFLFTVKHMMRFHRGATVLFAMLAGATGAAAALAFGAATSG